MMPPELIAGIAVAFILANIITAIVTRIVCRLAWTEDTLRKCRAGYRQVYILSADREELHLDQELTAPRQKPNCKIPEDWTRGIRRLDGR